MSLSEEIADFVSSQMNLNGVNQNDLARATGLSRQTINKIVNARSGSTVCSVEKLFDYFSERNKNRAIAKAEQQ